MEILLSFAQEREDIILYHMLRNIEPHKIFWIDVGANDPVDISVTKFFSCRGGHGINIEPQRDLIEKLNQDRPKDLNLEVGVSNKRGTLKLHGHGSGASFDSENPYVKDADTYDIPVMTLAEICEQYLINTPPPPLHFDNDIHFLKIDVEGWERQCLEGMNFNKFRPWIICMESTLPGTDIPCYDKWEDILLANNYILVGTSGINRYYLAKEARERVSDFCDGDQLDKFYKIINYNSSIDDIRQYEYFAQTPISKILLLKLKLRLRKYKIYKYLKKIYRKLFPRY